ncbi:MAG: HAMP domain-containing sensor histidine kinase [Planctomycetota bacterium]
MFERSNQIDVGIEPQAGSGWLGTNRRIILTFRSLLLVILGLIAWSQRESVPEPQYLFGLVVLFGLSNVLLIVPKNRALTDRISSWMFLFDTTVVSLFIFWAGGARQEFFLAYFLTIFIAALSSSMVAAFGNTVVVSCIYGLLSFYGKTGDAFDSTTFWIRVTLLYVTAMFVGFLSQEIKKSRDARRNAELIRAGLESRLSEAVRELRDKNASLAEKNERIVEFTKLITHDLKKPLTVLKMSFKLLLEDQDIAHGKAVPILQNGRKAMSYMEDLIRDILEAKPEAFADPEHRGWEDVDLGELVDQAWQRINFDGKSGAVDFLREPLPTVFCDRKAMNKVFMNLIGNALHYLGDRDNPRIRVASRQVGDEHVLEVCDNGIGIPEADRASVFQKFQRGSNSREVPGSGLGLYIVQKVVSAHQGRVWADAAPEGGARICFALPCNMRQSTGEVELLPHLLADPANDHPLFALMKEREPVAVRGEQPTS